MDTWTENQLRRQEAKEPGFASSLFGGARVKRRSPVRKGAGSRPRCRGAAERALTQLRSIAAGYASDRN